jgi:hypothetical protein
MAQSHFVSSAQFSEERAAARRGNRARQLDALPSARAFDVAASAFVCEQMKVEKRFAPKIEDAALLFRDAGPRAHFCEHAGEIVE